MSNLAQQVYRSAIHQAIAEANLVSVADIKSGSVAVDTDVSRELGLEREAVARRRKKEAVLDPDGFDNAHQGAIDEMEKRVKDAYMTSYNQYIQAGYTKDDAKKKGMHIARETKDALESAIHSEFGDDSRAIAAAKQITKSAAARTGISW